MRYMRLLLSVILSCFSTVVMSYISMATPIGPWIAPTITLCAMLCYGLFCAGTDFRLALVYITVAGSVGGILATAFGFSFPTLYFLDPELFDSWMRHPYHFASFVSVFAGIASWYSVWIANLTENHFLEQEQLSFPIAQMLYKIIGAYNEKKKVFQLGIGFCITTLFCIILDGFRCFSGAILKRFAVLGSCPFSWMRILAGSFELWPMLLAIGFVTGQMIVLPLLTGALCKALALEPLHGLLFSGISRTEFLLAFCSGMVLSGILHVFTPAAFIQIYRNFCYGFSHRKSYMQKIKLDRNIVIEGVLVLSAASMFLFYLQCGILLQIYLLFFTFVCAYQIIAIAGKIGLAQLGRFATFVLVPGLFLFNLNAVQIMVVTTFVEAVSGVAVDLLSGRKLVQLADGSQRIARRYQYIGIIVSCVALGLVFWLLINRFKLGSPELFAQRSKARQLLISVQQFDYWVLCIGVLFGLVLKKCKINPMLVLGGVLMPVNISLVLILGGFGALFTSNKEGRYPFWSGVFAANSIWMLLQALI